MSIEKNRNLMENQVKRLKGQLNEAKVVGGLSDFEFEEKVEDAIDGVYGREVEKAEKTTLKKLMPVLKKLFIGQVIPDEEGNPDNLTGKTFKKVFINPDWGGHEQLYVEIQLTNGDVVYKQYAL